MPSLSGHEGSRPEAAEGHTGDERRRLRSCGPGRHSAERGSCRKSHADGRTPSRRASATWWGPKCSLPERTCWSSGSGWSPSSHIQQIPSGDWPYPRRPFTSAQCLFQPISECDESINDIIDQINVDRWPVPQGHRPLRATGAALAVAVTLLEVRLRW